MAKYFRQSQVSKSYVHIVSLPLWKYNPASAIQNTALSFSMFINFTYHLEDSPLWMKHPLSYSPHEKLLLSKYTYLKI